MPPQGSPRTAAAPHVLPLNKNMLYELMKRKCWYHQQQEQPEQQQERQQVKPQAGGVTGDAARDKHLGRATLLTPCASVCQCVCVRVPGV